MTECTFATCDKQAKVRGLCAGHARQAHHSKMLVPLASYERNLGKTCEGPECDLPATARGLCGTHKSQRARGRVLSVIGSRKPGPRPKYEGVTCKFAECKNKPIARELCHAHYQQALRGHELHPIGEARPVQAVACVTAGCPASSAKRGYCERHYRQARRRGLLGDLAPCSENSCTQPATAARGLCGKHYGAELHSEQPPCAIDDCGQPTVGRGWCRTHYSRWRRHGDPLAWVKRSKSVCSVEGCARVPAEVGICAMHRARIKRYGQTELPPAPEKTGHSPYTCKQCGADLPKLKNGRRSYCSAQCREIWQYHDRQANHRRRWLKQYGLTVAEFDAMLAAQSGTCAICSRADHTARNWCVDHCHATGVVRGILCSECNAAIGKLKDDPALLRRAAGYIEAARSHAVTPSGS